MAMLETLCTFIGALVLMAILLAGIATLAVYLIFRKGISITGASVEEDPDDNFSNK